ncbi:FAS1 domain-containing protein [Hypoxylon trugodes]|uniref:FAS1 domain-containing protein n=1 Tax=Hypoxylon trugodes TaxID=326681 RepID=UPI00219AF0EC|nr:FAS1 domain-containing protein [Hypoxylon trugodes]KAI1392075.1 FAS1 domain-containing protein [Hypoxylon trugodes]
MRYSTAILPFVASAAAIIIPDEATAKQLILENEQKAEKTVSSWLDDALPAIEDTFESAREALERQTSRLSGLLPKIEVGTEGIDDILSPSDYNSDADKSGPGRSTNLTVYQSIKASNYTKHFAKIVDDFPDIVEKLNSTSSNITLFVPTEHAFKKLPKHVKEHKPPREFVEKILQYHVVPDLYPVGRVLAHHTLPTAFEEEALGGRPQRLRVSVSLFGIKVNFFSKVSWANLNTKNGVVHGIDSILVPPPPAGRLISLFPTKFSTLELAAQKTGFYRRPHDNTTYPSLTGLTVFAPTNTAFKKLGPAVNAFLFNTPKGLHYLEALLAYHVVANETLYSDEYYGKQSFADFLDSDYINEDEIEALGGEVEGEEGKPNGHFHLDLPTLLDDAHLAVDIARWYGFIKIKVNGRVDVAIQDGLAKDGVLQVVDSVIIPPHKHKKDASSSSWVDGEISVEELVERLDPYIKSEESKKKGESEVEVGEL